MWGAARSDNPIFDFQAADAFELAGVAGHDGGACRAGVGCNEHVVAADRFTRGFQLRTDGAVFAVGGSIEWQHVHFSEQIFDSLEQPFRATLCTSVPQFSGHDDAGANVLFTSCGDPFGCFTLWISNEIRNDVRIEHVKCQRMSSDAGAGSSTFRNASSKGFIDFNKETRVRTQ